MKIWCSHYSLNKKLSGAKHQSVEGVLFKFESGGRESYSLYQPIASLGDRSVSEIKKLLIRERTEEPTIRRIIDAAISFDDLKSNEFSHLKSYYSAGDGLSLTEGGLASLIDSGFKSVKLKVTDLSRINFELFKGFGINLILDFNQKGSALEIEKLIESEFSSLIKYLEDPPPFKSDKSISIGKDFDKSLEDYSYLIHKPSGFEKEWVLESDCKNIFTSYLDHPLGQIIAAIAVPQDSKEEHGLLTQHFYEENEYSEILSKDSLFRFDFFDDLKNLLKKERWVLL